MEEKKRCISGQGYACYPDGFGNRGDVIAGVWFAAQKTEKNRQNR